MNKSVIRKLKRMQPCGEAMVWVKGQSSKQVAWDSCKRGDWMLWILGQLGGKPESPKRKKLVLCAFECVAMAVKYSGSNRTVILRCLRASRAWARGTGNIDDVRAAADAAHAAAEAAYAASSATYAATYAGEAAYAAADAADAAYAATYAASYAAYAVADAVEIGDEVAYASVRIKTLMKCANIVRKHYPKAPRF
jgi:hypothetical protein